MGRTDFRKAGSASTGFHVMAKPSGPACNLDCDYCFYLEKDSLFEPRKQRRMSDDVLEAYVHNTIASTPPSQPVLFAWQGGEPTLMGLDFFRRAMRLQKKHGTGRVIENTFQTNGTLITDEWAAFLADNHFLVGLSLDGPEFVHDRHRRYRTGAGSHARVMAALERLQRRGAEYNVLACVDSHSARYPLETYRFLRTNGVRFIQFTPIVERLADSGYAASGLTLQGPSGPGSAAIAPFTVGASDWGRFLSDVFDEWRSSDVGSVFVMNFEWALASLIGVPGIVCVHQQDCGRALAAEHNGEVYSCDHYVYPEFRLGNLVDTSLAAMVESSRQIEFGKAKSATLPTLCRKCPVLESCWGGCPKHRFLETPDGEPGLNYLCEGYRQFFSHAAPALERIRELISAGRPAADVMRRGPTDRGQDALPTPAH